MTLDWYFFSIKGIMFLSFNKEGKSMKGELMQAIKQQLSGMKEGIVDK